MPRQRLLALLAAICLAWPGERATAATPEAQVKAAYLYKLASFVRWPPTAMRQGPFRMCVAGRDDVAGLLAELARGERVEGLPIEVRRLRSGQGPAARDCHILFLGRGPATARNLLDATAGSPVLTVADRDGGTRGGVIDFLLRDGRVRLAVARDHAAMQQLELSSKLLDIALEAGR